MRSASDSTTTARRSLCAAENLTVVQCVILAGGLGTRMRPDTESIPKAMLPVGGHPFAGWQLSLLAAEGVEEVVYCLGYLGEQVEAFVGDGSRWGLSVRYTYERSRLLGTAGALRLAADAGLLRTQFFVLYGDSYLPIRFAEVAKAFCVSRQPALMTVYPSSDPLEQANASYRDGMVTCYDKRTNPDKLRLNFIDYGLSVLTFDVITELVPADGVHDLADTYRVLSSTGRLAGYLASHRYFEIGSPRGIADLEAHLSLRRPASTGTP